MNGNIPTLFIKEKTLSKAWEESLIKLYEYGCDIKTQYDNPNDPPSKDCTMIIEIENPLSEPMIHRGFPAGIEDLQEYTMEVCDGIKDHWIDKESETKWDYTYHSRMFNYDVTKVYVENDGSVIHNHINSIDQIENLCQSLAKSPYSRIRYSFYK